MTDALAAAILFGSLILVAAVGALVERRRGR